MIAPTSTTRAPAVQMLLLVTDHRTAMALRWGIFQLRCYLASIVLFQALLTCYLGRKAAP